ncbi:MAG: arsenate reductase ArsC [Calditrichaeota bacterium]|nr:arsenate reductase ArsC [Calditrichota bacterium]
MAKKILVLCTGNSFRSQIAEAYLRDFAGTKADVFSAGVQASGTVYPYAVQLMAEDGIDISGQKSKTLDQFINMEFDFLITVCDHAKESCPIFPKPVGKKLHHSFPDYTEKGDQSKQEYLSTLRPIRDAIKGFCREFVRKHLI